jgi:hypothetical protein
VTEEIAGTAFLCRNAFLVGNGVFGGADQILTRADDANDGENTDGYCQIPTVLGRVAKRAVNRSANMSGNVAAATATAAFGGRFKNLGTKYDRIYDLHDGNGGIGGVATELRGAAEIVVGRALEDTDVALSAEENDLFLKHRNALEFLNATGADAGLKGELDVEFDVDGVESAIEGNRVDVDLCPGDAGTLDTDVGRVRYDVIPKIGQQYTDVLEAITVATGVENAVCLDADRISDCRGRTSELVICHKRIPPCEMEALTGNALL